MPLEKPTYHHGDLRLQIERIAWQKVSDSGADKLSLRSCARDAGVDPAAVYRHFRSKDDILIHLANRAFADMSAAMETAEKPYIETDPKEALVQVGLAYISYAVAHPHVFQMMFDMAGRCTHEDLTGLSFDAQKAYDLLVNGVARLNPKTPAALHVATLWSLVHGFSNLANSGLGLDHSGPDELGRALCVTAVDAIV